MGHSLAKEASDFSSYFETFKDDLLKGTQIIKEVISLSYEEFIGMVKELNQIYRNTVDCNGRTLLFVVKGGSDSTILWKQTVQVACLKVIKESKKVEDFKMLNLAKFIQVYKVIHYHMQYFTDVDTSSQKSSSADDNETHLLKRNPISTSMILNQIESTETATDLEECIICMERKPEVTLPCAHSYCLFCIEQWNVSNKTCPVCREALENTDDSWVIPEIPESSEINAEFQKALTNLTSSLSE